MSLFAQDISIPTKFLEDGNLYKNLDKTSNQLSEPVVAFSINDKCVVIGFLGRDNYKVRFKEWEGIVKDIDLLVTEKMSDLYFDFQEKESLKAIELEKNESKKCKSLFNMAKCFQMKKDKK